MQHVGIEKIDAHGARDHSPGCRASAAWSVLGFSSKPVMRPLAVDFDDAEMIGLLGIDQDGGQSDVGAGVAVLLQHQLVIHLVDVVAGEDEHVLGLLGADGVDVLVDGVGGALIPVVAHALHGRQDLDELAHLAADDVPAFADMAIERQRLVLGEDVDAAQVGIDAVGEGDVDDAVDAAEGHGRLGAVARQGIERSPAPPASSTPRVSFIIRKFWDG